MTRNVVKKRAAVKAPVNAEPSLAQAVSRAVQKSESALRGFALTFPEAVEDFPWGERAIKVKQKVFLFLRTSEEGLSLGVKLSAANSFALTLPFCEPTHHGLGKSGWVTAKFAPKEKPPLPLLQEWIAESYRAVAPKRLVVALEAKAGKKKPAKKKR